MRLGEVLAEIGAPVAFYPSVSRAVKGVAPGLFLCQLCYWHGKQADPDGWIRKSWKDFEAETGLSRQEQRTARSTLRGLHILEERVRGNPATTEYRINFDVLAEVWGAIGSHHLDGWRQPTRWLEATNQLVGSNQQDGCQQPTIKGTEITSETTSETTQRERRSGRRRALPPDFVLTAEMAEAIRGQGCRDPAKAFAQFSDHHESRGTLLASWPAGWRTWVARHAQFGCACQGNTRDAPSVAGIAPGVARVMSADELKARMQAVNASAKERLRHAH